jgi:hypothetical protein
MTASVRTAGGFSYSQNEDDRAAPINPQILKTKVSVWPHGQGILRPALAGLRMTSGGGALFFKKVRSTLDCLHAGSGGFMNGLSTPNDSLKKFIEAPGTLWYFLVTESTRK